MRNPSNPPASDTAAKHAERIRAREEKRSAAEGAPQAGQTTAELYAQRILPGYQADAALREEARKNEMRARGQWVPGDDQDDDEEVADEEVAEDGEFDPTDSPERRSARAAWRSASTGGYMVI